MGDFMGEFNRLVSEETTRGDLLLLSKVKGDLLLLEMALLLPVAAGVRIRMRFDRDVSCSPSTLPRWDKYLNQLRRMLIPSLVKRQRQFLTV